MQSPWQRAQCISFTVYAFSWCSYPEWLTVREQEEVQCLAYWQFECKYVWDMIIINQSLQNRAVKHCSNPQRFEKKQISLATATESPNDSEWHLKCLLDHQSSSQSHSCTVVGSVSFTFQSSKQWGLWEICFVTLRLMWANSSRFAFVCGDYMNVSRSIWKVYIKCCMLHL